MSLELSLIERIKTIIEYSKLAKKQAKNDLEQTAITLKFVKYHIEHAIQEIEN